MRKKYCNDAWIIILQFNVLLMWRSTKIRTMQHGCFNCAITLKQLLIVFTTAKITQTA